MSINVRVSRMPACDFAPASIHNFDGRCSQGGEGRMFDFKTKVGPWANGCLRHYLEYRLFGTLGTGKGQELILDPPCPVCAKPVSQGTHPGCFTINQPEAVTL